MISTKFPLSLKISSQAALAVPPVAIRSSINNRFALGLKASICASISSTPYSHEYFSEIVAPGNLPFFLKGTNPAPSLSAKAAPKIKPRLSIPTT